MENKIGNKKGNELLTNKPVIVNECSNIVMPIETMPEDLFNIITSFLTMAEWNALNFTSKKNKTHKYLFA